ncbi:peptidase M23 [Marinobacter sp. X15-166B]|nr:peptidase M23 [Marinobacter sp. X15-166B]
MRWGVLLCLWLTLAVPLAQAETQPTPAQINALKKQIAEIDRWLGRAEQRRTAGERALASTEQQISRLTRERRELQQQIREHHTRLNDLKNDQAELTATLDRQRESLKQLIRVAWMQGDTPAIKVLLNETDPHQVARTLTYFEYLSEDTVARLNAFNATLSKLQTTHQAVTRTGLELTRLEAEAASRQQALQQSKQQRQRDLATLSASISKRKGERQTLESDRVRLEKILRDLEEAIANIPTPNESQPFRSLRSKLPWPAQGTVVQRFGERYADGRLRQNGMLLSTQPDAEVTAVHYGRVVFANWLRGFGLMTIIDHGGGYMTLYGHSSSLLTSPGDWVAAGAPIAIAGQTGGSSHPAVYFEVRYQGKPTNPQRWLAKR